jgi:hypothetical protein
VVDLPPDPDIDPAARPRPPSPSRALLVYNLSRLGLFAVATAIVYAVGVRDIWAALLIGLFASAIASWFLLRRQREAMAVVMEQAVQERKRRAAERAAREDAWDEEQRRAAGDDGSRRDDSAPGT